MNISVANLRTARDQRISSSGWDGKRCTPASLAASYAVAGVTICQMFIHSRIRARNSFKVNYSERRRDIWQI